MKQKLINFIQQPWFKRSLIASLGLGLLFLCIWLSVRGAILEKGVNKALNKFSKVKIGSYHWEGVFTVFIGDLTVLDAKNDTLLYSKSLAIRPNLWGAIRGQVQVRKLVMEQAHVKLHLDYIKETIKQFKTESKGNTEDVESLNLAEKVESIINKVFNVVPEKMILNQISGIVFKDTTTWAWTLPQAEISGSELAATLQWNANNKLNTWEISGEVEPRSKQIDLFIKGNNVQAPLISDLYQCNLSFDELELGLNNIEVDQNQLIIETVTSTKNFKLQQPKIASTPIEVEDAKSNLNFTIGDWVGIDSSSVFEVGKIKGSIGVYYQLKNKEVKVTANIPEIPASDFFGSLPKGLFSHVRGIEADGTFGYTLNAYVPIEKPDRTYFNSKVLHHDLKIKHFKADNLAKMNSGFSYTAYEKGVPVKTFMVGAGNPGFISLSQVPPILQACVLTSEDGSFWGHRGFNENAFRSSIVENVKKRKFARGGSTISMQLVKNVFLSRNKTVARKAEEALIVWLIENEHLTSKARMLEVYFNIIEWGPMVYGLNSASYFYFAKSPYELSFQECLFLAGIIPRPKKFMWSFDETGHLRDYMKRYMEFMGNVMLRKGLITPEQRLSLVPDVELKGPALSYLRIASPVDSVVTEESIFLEE